MQRLDEIPFLRCSDLVYEYCYEKVNGFRAYDYTIDNNIITLYITDGRFEYSTITFRIRGQRPTFENSLDTDYDS